MANCKIKIVEKGWETFSDNIGGVDFVDGVSVREVTEYEIARIAGSIQVINLETGKQLNDAATLSENIGTVLDPRPDASVITQKQFDQLNVNDAPAKPEVVGAKVYTNDELLKIADEKGINGLRDIGNTLSVKGRAIPELIENILAAQAVTNVPKAPDAPAAA
jgi:hypothetical protein